MLANSQNFDPDSPVTGLGDGCTDGTAACTPGAAAYSFWVEFDFGSPYTLTTARLFGDADGKWTSNSWDFQYKQNAADAWQSAFTDSNALGNQCFPVSLNNVTARYARVTVHGNPTTNATQARELEIYGTPSPSPTATPTPTVPPLPTPVSCHLYTTSSVIPTGYGVPWDVLSGLNEMLIKATRQNLTDATLDFGKGSASQYIYKTGYHYHPGLSGWTPINLSSLESLIVNAW
jgi:hypothetical protein